MTEQRRPKLPPAERRAKARELVSGPTPLSYRQIAARLGCSVGTVASDLAALNGSERGGTEQLNELEVGYYLAGLTRKQLLELLGRHVPDFMIWLSEQVASVGESPASVQVEYVDYDASVDDSPSPGSGY